MFPKISPGKAKRQKKTVEEIPEAETGPSEGEPGPSEPEPGPSHYQPPSLPGSVSLQVELENVKREIEACKEDYKY